MTGTAELIARVRQPQNDFTANELADEIAVALAAQAQEIERLTGDRNLWLETWTAWKSRAEAAEARVRELEHRLKTVHNTMELLQNGISTIEAATIERCAQVIEKSWGTNNYSVADGCAAAIRALAKEPPEDKT